MASVGLTTQGFVPDTYTDIRASMEDDMRSAFQRSLPLGNRTLLGFMIGAIAERLALLWEIAEMSFKMMDPDQALGAYLEALCLLSATFRAAAEMSIVMLTLCGDDGTLVTAQNIVMTASTSKNFSTFADATITALTTWTVSTSFDKDDRVTNAARCYQCITAGTSASSVGPNTTDLDITDGTAHWTYLGEGAAAIDVIAVSEDTGPIVATARDLTIPGSPFPGWNTVTNLLDAVEGRDEAGDEELRLTREAEIAAPGKGTPDAVRAALLNVTGVTQVRVFANLTEITDDNGIPPHTARILVQGGDDQAIRDCIWANMSLGIGTIGTTTGVALDSEGNEQPVSFSRPVALLIYQYVSLTKNPKTYAGDTTAKGAIAALGVTLNTGDDVEQSAVGSATYAIGGIKSIDEVRIYTDVIAAGAQWLQTTAYSAVPGSRSVVTNEGRSYICVVSGTSASSGLGPLGIGTSIVDGAARWRFLGAQIDIADEELAVFDTSRMTIVATSQTSP